MKKYLKTYPKMQFRQKIKVFSDVAGNITRKAIDVGYGASEVALLCSGNSLKAQFFV